MKLHIVIRTHDGKNIHGNKLRYIDMPKNKLIIGCLSSIINSANLIKNHHIHFTILDDHSTEKFISSLHSIFKKSIHSWELINLKERGFNHSGYMQFLTCKNSDFDLVYSVEDDYLHHENAISEMLFTYKYLKIHYNIKKELCIFPFDNPEDYAPHELYSGKVFRTPIRHWKEGIWTTFTMMTTPKIFRKYWKIFEKLALNYKPFAYGEDKHKLIDEGNTISNIWKNEVIRINPIPSLAIHIQFEEQRDPHIDHLCWWNRYSQIKKSILLYK